MDHSAIKQTWLYKTKGQWLKLKYILQRGKRGGGAVGKVRSAVNDV